MNSLQHQVFVPRQTPEGLDAFATHPGLAENCPQCIEAAANNPEIAEVNKHVAEEADIGPASVTITNDYKPENRL